MPAVLKLSFQREVRRIIMEKEISYEHVCGTIHQAWPELQTLTAKYVDEEGDLCVFSEASFSDFLAVSAATASGKTTGQLILRLEFVAAEAMSSSKQTPLQSEADLSSNTSTNGEPEQIPFFSWWRPQGWGPHAHGHGWNHWQRWHQGSWEGKHCSPHLDHHGHGHRHLDVKMFPFYSGQECGGHKDGMDWEGNFGRHDAGHHKWGTHKEHGQEWLLKPKKMLWLLTQLHASEALSSPAAVSLWVYWLPQAVQVLSLDSEEAGRKLRKQLPNIQTVLQNLIAASKSVEGLEHCEGILTQLLAANESDSQHSDEAAGELLVSLLTAFAGLSFEKQVKFFEVFYELQKDGLHELADSWKSWCCAVPMDHQGVQCDNCGQTPITGLRFKSTTLEDYDLCSECFCNKHSFLDDDHQFKHIPMDWANMWWKKQHMKESWGECKEAWKAWPKGKGCKGKGGKGKDGKGKGGKGQDSKGKGCKGKGKGNCKRSACDAELEGPDSQRTCVRAEAKKCAHPGCNFQCTWHPTHCCAACKSSADGTVHGPRCERIVMTAADTVCEDGWVLANEPTPPGLVEEETEFSKETEETEWFEEDTELSKAKKLKEMGFDASEASEALKNCGGDLSKALEALSINEP